MKTLTAGFILVLLVTMSLSTFAQVQVTGSHTATNYGDAYVPMKLHSAEKSHKSCSSRASVATGYATAYIPQKLSGCAASNKCINKMNVAKNYANAYSRQELSDCS